MVRRSVKLEYNIDVNKEKETETQPGFEPGSSKLQLDEFTTELLELWQWSRVT